MEKTPENRIELARMVSQRLEEVLNRLFVEVHEFAQTQSGDIDPMQMVEKNDLSQQLVELIVTQVWQNL